MKTLILGPQGTQKAKDLVKDKQALWYNVEMDKYVRRPQGDTSEEVIVFDGVGLPSFAKSVFEMDWSGVNGGDKPVDIIVISNCLDPDDFSRHTDIEIIRL